MNKSPISIMYANSGDGDADPRVTWLDLPATPAEIDRAMLRIGLFAAPSRSKMIGFPDSAHAGARAIRYKTDIAGLAEHLTINPGIEYLNRLAACLSVMNRAALRRFTLFLRTEGANSFSVILKRAQHLTSGRERRRQVPAPGR